MDAAFLVRIRRAGAPPLPPPSTVGALEVGFEPVGSGSWSSADGDVQLRVWWGPRRPDGGALHVAPDTATFVVGDVRWPGDAWADPGRWAALLAERAPAAGPDGVQEAVAGVYASGHLGVDGRGWLVTDPLGLRCTYWAEGSDAVVVGSRAALVAAAVDGRPTADLDGVSWLAHMSYWVGSRTGFAGVRLAPAGHVGVIDRSGVRWRPGPVLAQPTPVTPEDARPLADAAATVIAEVADGLVAALSRPADRHVIQLTGGRDSRTLLAVALATGLADRFEFETNGPDRLDDVRVARELAVAHGLRHDVRFFGMRGDEPDVERRRRWVQQVAGMVSAWEAPGRTMPDLRITGVGGEFLRSYRRIAAPPGATLDARKVVGRVRPGRLGLLQPEVAEARDHDLGQEVRPDGAPGHGHRDVHLYYARNRMRFTRLGPRQEVLAEERVLPLYGPGCVRAALAVWAPDRQEGGLYAEVLRQTVPALADHRYAAAGLVAATPGTADPGSGGSPAAVAGVGGAGAVEQRSLVASLFSKPSDERTELVASVLADAANPVWGVLDRGAALGAAARWDDLHVVERRELFGAVSAAMWVDAVG